MKQIGIIGTGILLGLMVVALFGCDSFETSRQEFASAPNNSKPDDSSPGEISKAFDAAAFYSATVTDPSGNPYVVTYNPAKSGFSGGQTTFAYDLEIGSLSGFHFALEIPECSFEAFAGSVPDGNWNGNPNGNLEFGPEDFKSETETVFVVFDGEVSLGVVFASFKYGGAGDTPKQVAVYGPCQQVDYYITGTVFLDDPSNAGGQLGVQDASEPGIGGVVVALFEWDGTPNQGQETTTTLGDGSYSFHVLGPPIFNGNYRVEILGTGGGLNAQLFDPDGFWKLSDTAVRDVDLNVSSDVPDIGFWLDVNKAIEVFENPDVYGTLTDMLPREFWRVQVTGRGSKKYKPVVDDPTMDAFIATINTFSDHIDYVFGLGGINRAEAGDILQTASKSDPQAELKTLALAALFNYVAGRGACEPGSALGPNPDATDPIQEYVCVVGPDLDTTRLIIEQALVEWMRIEGVSLGDPLGKESGGSMSRVLNAMM